MRDKYLERKIIGLSNAKLMEVLRLGNAEKGEIFAVAEEEANLRKLEYIAYTTQITEIQSLEPKLDVNSQEFKQFNWGACFLAFYWCLSNKMDYWVFLLCIPIVNFGVMLYLGFNGNRLAFEKSDFDSPNDFLKVQVE